MEKTRPMKLCVGFVIDSPSNILEKFHKIFEFHLKKASEDVSGIYKRFSILHILLPLVSHKLALD